MNIYLPEVPASEEPLKLQPHSKFISIQVLNGMGLPFLDGVLYSPSVYIPPASCLSVKNPDGRCWRDKQMYS